jgi:acid phosphatase (class A)
MTTTSAHRTVKFFIAAVAAAALVPAFAQTAGNAFEKELRQPTYLTADEVPNGVEFLPPPPSWTSPLFAGDYAGYLWGKTVRPTPRGAKAVEQAAFLFDEFAKFFSKPFGLEISREKTPAIYKVLSKGVITARLSTIGPKAEFNRTRPYVRYGEGTPFPETEELLKTNGAYPSGHSVRGWCMALLTTEINPAAQNELLKLGHEWGESRVIIGYHWKSDVEAGRALAGALYARLHACEEFLADMAEARREFKRLTGGRR